MRQKRQIEIAKRLAAHPRWIDERRRVYIVPVAVAKVWNTEPDLPDLQDWGTIGVLIGMLMKEQQPEQWPEWALREPTWREYRENTSPRHDSMYVISALNDAIDRNDGMEEQIGTLVALALFEQWDAADGD